MALSDSKLVTLEVTGDGTNDRAQGYVGAIDLSTAGKVLDAPVLTNIQYTGVVLPPSGLLNDGVADVCIAGECLALVDGDSANVSVGDLLEVTAAGTFIRYSVAIPVVSGTGTDDIVNKVRAISLEAETDATPSLRLVFLVHNPISVG